MTGYLIDVCEVVHTCPADPNPHPIDIRRTVVAVTPGGPCRQLQPAHPGGTGPAACRERLPGIEQCPACRITTTVRTVRTVHAGPAATARPAPPRPAPAASCAACDLPLAAELVGYGLHLLCGPTEDGHR